MVTPAVIVPGAAAGIGRATVELFSERGYGWLLVVGRFRVGMSEASMSRGC